MTPFFLRKLFACAGTHDNGSNILLSQCLFWIFIIYLKYDKCSKYLTTHNMYQLVWATEVHLQSWFFSSSGILCSFLRFCTYSNVCVAVCIYSYTTGEDTYKFFSLQAYFVPFFNAILIPMFMWQYVFIPTQLHFTIQLFFFNCCSTVCRCHWTL